jgi:hypothetical protein
MITKNYIKMCEKAPRKFWDKQSKNSRIGTLIAWRSFLGIVVPCKKRKKMEGLVSFIPETLVTRTWLKDDEDITILETNVDYCSVNPDKGTPVYSQEQLQEMIFDESVGVQTITSAIEQFSKSAIGCSISIMGDMNELWLTFVMKEKYNKTWDGEKWK